ncbi:hypothetical protein ACOSQ3_019731 [Xanthoceras sorbifolium]
MSSNNSSHAPLSFDHSLLIPEEPSLDFQSLARTLNFNLPLKLDKSNYVNWKAQSLSASTLLAIIYCKSWHPWTATYCASPEVVNDPSWYAYNGATNHVTSDLNNLSLST